MQIELVDSMGTDLTVVNSARVSFAKTKKKVDVSDKKLINYLANHNHWSPFAHTCLQFYIKAPMFVARQLAKHQVGLVWNEVSRRYINTEPEYWKANNKWRKAADDKKQGSSLDIIASQSIAEHAYADACRHSVDAYKLLISMGVCPEQSRAVLPVSLYTEWYWSGSVYAFSRVCKLRMAKDAQKETQDVVSEISFRCKQAFPLSWAALKDSVREPEWR